MSVTYTPGAAQDYENIFESAQLDWPGHAAAIIARLHKGIAHLDSFPLGAELVHPGIRRLPGLRFLPLERVGNRVIYYQVLPSETKIIRILHGSMDFRRVLQDEPMD